MLDSAHPAVAWLAEAHFSGFRERMLLKVLRSKIHRATVTGADLDYVGSISIDRALMEAVGLVEGQCVLVADLDNGTRHETYVIAGQAGEVAVNGAAAKLVSPGDKVIVMAFAYVSADQAAQLKPQIALVDDKNRLIRML